MSNITGIMRHAATMVSSPEMSERSSRFHASHAATATSGEKTRAQRHRYGALTIDARPSTTTMSPYSRTGGK